MDVTLLDGLRQSHRNRVTGTLINIYNADEAGLDPDGGDWVTVCEDHSEVCNHTTLSRAREWSTAPQYWCPRCKVLERLDRIYEDRTVWNT